MMNDMLSLGISWVAGVLLGAMFFGGLWWTVRRGVASRRPGLLFFASLMLRTSLVVAGAYFVGRGNGQPRWQPLLLCLLGFAVARLIVMWLTRPAAEVRHAS